MSITFPGESADYRAARVRLLDKEIELRRATEAVAAARRALPPGGVVPQDYVFQREGAGGAPTDVRLSELFAPGRDALVIYNFMFPRDPGDQRPGPQAGQTALLRLLSSANNTYNRDYHGETAEGSQRPMLNVFHRDGETIRHFWGSELFYAPTDPGQDPRHVGTLEPLWNLFDLTPQGRPTNWDEQLRYPGSQ